MPLTKFGEEWIARTLFEKGLRFLAAGQLLEPYCVDEPSRYVRLHLLCQGSELILKSALLARNFKKYRPKLHKHNEFGHHLMQVAQAAKTEFGLAAMRPGLSAELGELEHMYCRHDLSYAGLNDILIGPAAIGVEHVLCRVKALVRLVNREFNRTNFGQI